MAAAGWTIPVIKRRQKTSLFVKNTTSCRHWSFFVALRTEWYVQICNQVAFTAVWEFFDVRGKTAEKQFNVRLTNCSIVSVFVEGIWSQCKVQTSRNHVLYGQMIQRGRRELCYSKARMSHWSWGNPERKNTIIISQDCCRSIRGTEWWHEVTITEIHLFKYVFISFYNLLGHGKTILTVVRPSASPALQPPFMPNAHNVHHAGSKVS